MAKRDFFLRDADAWQSILGVDWPPGQQRDGSNLNLAEYTAHFLLICPECGEVWCRSTHTPARNSSPDSFYPYWCIRERYCATHLEAYVARRVYASPYDPWAPTYCPGSILSINRHELFEAASSIHWERLLFALPKEWRQRELHLWAGLDLLLNPPQPKEPAPDVSRSDDADPLVEFLPAATADAGPA